MTKSADPRLTRVKPVREEFSLNEKKDMPLYMKDSPFRNIKEMQEVKMKGVLHTNMAYKNKSDYTKG